MCGLNFIRFLVPLPSLHTLGSDYKLLMMLCPLIVPPPSQLRSVLSASLMCTRADKDQSNVQVH